MNATCPVCQRELYSRRRKTCGYCGAELPPEALFSEKEATEIAQSIEQMEARRRREKEAEEKRKEEGGSGHGGGWIGF